jgi:hypothetical protein
MLRAGISTTHTVSAIGLNIGDTGTPVDGLVMLSGNRIGTITP